MNNWIDCTLGDFITIQRGHDLPESKRNKGMVPVVGSAGLTGYHDQTKTKGPGVTIGRSGNSIGFVTYVPMDYWPLNTVLYVKDFKGNDKRFVYYFLKNMDFTILNSGSAQPSLNRNYMYPLQIRVPELDIQKQISNILSSLDDKIELNLRMNETLEQMVMALYKHWFVDVEDSREQILLSELLTLNPTMSVKKGTLLKYVDMKALPTSQMSVPDDLIIEREFTSGTKFTKNDVLMARITPCLENGKSAFVDFLSEGEIAFGSTEFLVFRANEISCPQFLYCLVRDKGFHEFAKQTMVGTSGRQRVQSSILLQYELPKPNPDIMNKFRGKTTEWFNKVRANTVENHILKQTRDYLLPRLLSGEIELHEAEKQVEEVL